VQVRRRRSAPGGRDRRAGCAPCAALRGQRARAHVPPLRGCSPPNNGSARAAIAPGSERLAFPEVRVKWSFCVPNGVHF
jgi:hypothetical protein